MVYDIPLRNYSPLFEQMQPVSVFQRNYRALFDRLIPVSLRKRANSGSQFPYTRKKVYFDEIAPCSSPRTGRDSRTATLTLKKPPPPCNQGKNGSISAMDEGCSLRVIGSSIELRILISMKMQISCVGIKTMKALPLFHPCGSNDRASANCLTNTCCRNTMTLPRVYHKMS